MGEATVLVLPAMEVTVLDTVSGRDLLMPGMDADMEVMVDTAVDMEVTFVTDMVDTDTESKFHTSINLLPFILISSHYTCWNNALFHSFHKRKTKSYFGMFHQKLRKSFEIDQKVNLKIIVITKMCNISTLLYVFFLKVIIIVNFHY